MPNTHSDRSAAPVQRDNLLGVCAALGEATGLDALVFRLAFVASMLAVSFEMTVVAYCVAAVAILAAQFRLPSFAKAAR